MKNEIFISSIAFNDRKLIEVIKICEQNNFNLEFSSSISYNRDNLKFLNEFNGEKLIHNYFPAPKEPFVINLASKDSNILRRSISHCKENIRRTAELGLNFYAVHAGFCIDPKVSSLGKKILSDGKFDKKQHLEIFIETLSELLKYSNEYDVPFLIENNVLSSQNYSANNNQNIFLCTDSQDIVYISKEINSRRFQLLLDTGHLKVSCKTLGIDLLKETNRLFPSIGSVHHSDNDGFEDLNLPIDKYYWFSPFLKFLKPMNHVIEVKNLKPELIINQKNILSSGF